MHFLSFLFVPLPETPVPHPKICPPIFLACSEETNKMLQFHLPPEMHHITTFPGYDKAQPWPVPSLAELLGQEQCRESLSQSSLANGALPLSQGLLPSKFPYPSDMQMCARILHICMGSIQKLWLGWKEGKCECELEEWLLRGAREGRTADHSWEQSAQSRWRMEKQYHLPSTCASHRMAHTISKLRIPLAPGDPPATVPMLRELYSA